MASIFEDDSDSDGGGGQGKLVSAASVFDDEEEEEEDSVKEQARVTVGRTRHAASSLFGDDDDDDDDDDNDKDNDNNNNNDVDDDDDDDHDILLSERVGANDVFLVDSDSENNSDNGNDNGNGDGNDNNSDDIDNEQNIKPVIYSPETNLNEGRPRNFGCRTADNMEQMTRHVLRLSKPELVDQGIREGYATSARGVAWRKYLGVLSESVSTVEDAVNELSAKRKQYEALLKQHRTNPQESEDDPLTTSSSNQGAWSMFYKEQELLETISKDLSRLYPNGCGDFFEIPHIQRTMLNVLFLWCQMHPTTSYRQGMHELLAPFVWQLESERLATHNLYDWKFVEHDSFWLFTSLMEEMEAMFMVRKVDSKALAKEHEEKRRLGGDILLRKRRPSQAARDKAEEAQGASATMTPRAPHGQQYPAYSAVSDGSQAS